MLLEVERLTRSYPGGGILRGATRAIPVLHAVSLHIPDRGALGLVGESGSGKSTLARTVLALEKPQSGTVRLEGVDLFTRRPSELRRMRRRMQAVFQDPNGSLDPRMRVGRIVAEPIAALEPETGRAESRARVAEALEKVGLPAGAMQRYPHDFSGGQRQRIAIARAIVARPALIVADEPVSALDVSVQAQILELIAQLREAGIGWLFISHDLAVVRIVCDSVAVLLRGHLVESGPAAAVFAAPLHPYTRTLVEASGGLAFGSAGASSVEAPAGGCPLAGACPREQAQCRHAMPALRQVADRAVACHAVTIG